MTSGAPAGRRAGSMSCMRRAARLGAGLGSRAKAPKIDKTPLASAVFLARRSGSLAKGLGAFRDCAKKGGRCEAERAAAVDGVAAV